MFPAAAGSGPDWEHSATCVRSNLPPEGRDAAAAAAAAAHTSELRQEVLLRVRHPDDVTKGPSARTVLNHKVRLPAGGLGHCEPLLCEPHHEC